MGGSWPVSPTSSASPAGPLPSRSPYAWCCPSRSRSSTLPLLSVPAYAAAPSSIAIDGDQDGLTTDWQGYSVGCAGPRLRQIADGIGNADPDGFRQGSSESDYDGVGNDKGWTVGSGVSSGKSDIGNVLVDSYRDGSNHLIAAIGWDRGSGVGTQNYWIELNQQTHSEVEPPRTTGDLRINLDVNGSTIQQCSGAQRWTAAGTWGRRSRARA